MGAEVGKPVSNLGITSMATVTPTIEPKEMTTLNSELKSVAEAKESEFITKPELDDAVKKSGKFDAADLDIFAKLFTLFDLKGDETVNYKDFLAGLTGCLMSVTILEKLKFVFGIYDTAGEELTTRSDLKRCLTAINSVASFFGDPVLSLADIDFITNELFDTITQGNSKTMPMMEMIDMLREHDLIKVFALGEAKIRFGMPELDPTKQ
mmetsp:Transcript_24893/g.41487  ORF Transcript_24893/g.41487 Transcript_24893/m.41487 type:complete len:209 (+) Transcript_24893:93-719(+)|eukprot:CAMPEP_0174973796 /NCGR_PEP_ID=MMETSP0004_2-20121128/11445_1 /TAXON_ID=420556 /ORGANISM="Ochromonas sp., Strain CCMP1393" /LENGTH=208 /DNA_ID=CAMNT_0016224293 /DNA_START=74 /DNA_END=700 /DNA_ORIENTATION=+